MGLTGLFLLTVVIAVSVAWLGPNQFLPASHSGARTSAQAQGSRTYFETHSMPEIEEAGIEAVKGFMQARNPEDAVEFIAGRELRLPNLKDYYQRSENTWPDGFRKIKKILPNTIAAISYLMIFAEDNSGVTHGYLALPGEGKMVIDWACSVAYGDLSKEDFFDQKPQNPACMRVMAQNDSLNDPHSILDTKMLFLRLENLERTDFFQVAFSPENDGLKKLFEILSTSSIRLPVQLELVWNEELRCPEAVSLVQMWWFDRDAIDLSNSRSTGLSD